MRFAVPWELTQVVIAWEQAVNWQVLRYQVAARGEAVVLRRGERRGLGLLKETPNLGEAEPHYTTFGGGFTYTFRSDAEGCVLTVAHITNPDTYAEHPHPEAGAAHLWQKPPGIYYPRSIPPLHLHVPQRPQIGQREDEQERWSSPQITSERTVQEASVEALRFWIDGEMFAKLPSTGWAPERLEAFRYRFTPLSVGCEIFVDRLSDGTTYQLTEDIEW